MTLAADDVYNSDHEQQLLALLLWARYRAMLGAVHELVRVSFGLDPNTFRVDDVATRRLLLEAATRVVRIDETTRQAITQRLAEGQMMGLSPYELAHGTADWPGIEGLFEETWNGRAQTVARTELTNAQIVATENRYLATGLVDRVRIYDGDYDEACASRNGRVVPITDQPRPLHPNCTMNLSPVLRGEELAA